MISRPGRFITFEGADGAGKSTQSRVLAKQLRACGIPTILTREVGGTAGAEAIRNVWLSGQYEWDALTELLLVLAARRDHINKIIKPALQRGEWVICDRFMDSTYAYQGAGQGLSPAIIKKIVALSLPALKPHTTFVLMVDEKISQRRMTARARDRFEEKISFQKRVNGMFRKIARQQPARCLVVDASREVEAVSHTIWQHIAKKYKLRHA
ncbi:MAG: dTMP kinase [Alphaproteobacteria bacterium]|nr:dTMP kinase [Alphaproteobacteria bacterium]